MLRQDYFQFAAIFIDVSKSDISFLRLLIFSAQFNLFQLNY